MYVRQVKTFLVDHSVHFKSFALRLRCPIDEKHQHEERNAAVRQLVGPLSKKLLKASK
jgi:hypothetical protein